MDDVWVVLACRKGSQENFWAWGRPRRDGPGFDEIFYTQRDGITAWSPSGDELPVLGEHLFTVVFPGEAVAQSGDRFHVAVAADSTNLRPDASWRPDPPTLGESDTVGETAGSAV